MDAYVNNTYDTMKKQCFALLFILSCFEGFLFEGLLF